MDNDINLNLFCSTDETRQTWMLNPFNIREKTIAANGHVLICVSKREGYRNIAGDKEKLIIPYLKQIEQGEYEAPPVISYPHKKETCSVCEGTKKVIINDCEECGGDGYESMYFEIECKTCNGDGNKKITGKGDTCRACGGKGEKYKVKNEADYIKINGLLLDPNFYELIKNFNNLKIRTDKTSKTLYFMADNAKGAIKGVVIICNTFSGSQPNSLQDEINKEFTSDDSDDQDENE